MNQLYVHIYLVHIYVHSYMYPWASLPAIPLPRAPSWAPCAIQQHPTSCFICGEGNGTPLQCFCLENPMDRGAWWAAVQGVVKSWTRLSDFTFTFHFMHGEGNGNPLRCSCLENPRDGEPGGLPSTGSHRVGHDWSNLAVASIWWILNTILK